ncbi:MAG: hypothetical protein RL398_3654 [Planctomycetota bacterium]
MMRPSLLLGSLVLVAGLVPGQQAESAAARPIDLALCLDVSGSMNGLIDAARQNLWAVVNELAMLKPAPRLRVALLTYGCTDYDKDKGWVKIDVAFTHDLDLVSERLFALTTNGGDEYVARVVRTASESLEWSREERALKLLFVAGNEAAGQDPEFAVADVCRGAIAKGIVVNSIYCGSVGDDLVGGWRYVATAAEGRFAAIDHNQSVVITTPYDAKLQELSEALNATYVPYGVDAAAWAENQVRQDANAASLNSAAAAQRCMVKGSGLYDNRQWDLVDACKDPKFLLKDVKKEHLPEALRDLDEAGLRRHIESKAAERRLLSKQVAALGKQRDAFVWREQSRNSQGGLFESAVLDAVREQAVGRGFAVADRSEVPVPVVLAELDATMVQTVALAAADYESFPRVTGTVKVAPEDCRIPPPPAALSKAEGAHGGKVYMLFARLAKGEQYVEPGIPAEVGETLVKEAWQAVPGPQTAMTPAAERYGFAPVATEGEKSYHGGEAAGLFVMHKLAPDTDGTDRGWVYGALNKSGVVTAAGKVAACMRCHEQATEDRRFGLR